MAYQLLMTKEKKSINIGAFRWRFQVYFYFGMIDHLSRIRQVPEMIVVAISNVDRVGTLHLPNT